MPITKLPMLYKVEQWVKQTQGLSAFILLKNFWIHESKHFFVESTESKMPFAFVIIIGANVRHVTFQVSP